MLVSGGTAQALSAPAQVLAFGGTGRQRIPLVRSFEGHTGPGKSSFYNLITPSSSALPGGYVRCKESQGRKELHYSAAFIYSEDTRLYKLCMNFSHLQE